MYICTIIIHIYIYIQYIIKVITLYSLSLYTDPIYTEYVVIFRSNFEMLYIYAYIHISYIHMYQYICIIKINFGSNSICPTCTQPINVDQLIQLECNFSAAENQTKLHCMLIVLLLAILDDWSTKQIVLVYVSAYTHPF